MDFFVIFCLYKLTQNNPPKRHQNDCIFFQKLPGHTFDGPASKHPSGLPSPWEFAPGLSAEMGMHLSLSMVSFNAMQLHDVEIKMSFVTRGVFETKTHIF